MHTRITSVFLAVVLAGTSDAQAARGRGDDGPPPGCCLCGQYWRVASLCVPICGGYDPSKLEYSVYDCRRGWVRSTFDAFLAADDPRIATCFFLPGYEPGRRTNQYEYVDNATKGGWLIYNRVAPRDRPFRVVLWAWPAESFGDHPNKRAR